MTTPSELNQMDHTFLVSKLVKPGMAIKEEMTADSAHLIHMIMGLCGETGELLDAIKKSVIYNKTLDIENVIEELGDIEFYLEGLRQSLGITRDETLSENISKLTVRYADLSYTDKAAQKRADKA
jgi:NTP pyrophosphatase (non-canonical NTP hydrolase)